MCDSQPLSEEEELRCSFCNKSHREIKKLIAGVGVYICNECIELCSDIIADQNIEQTKKKMVEQIDESIKKLSDLRGAINKIPNTYFEGYETQETAHYKEVPKITRQILIDEIMGSCTDNCPPIEQRPNIIVLIKHLGYDHRCGPNGIKSFLNSLGLKSFNDRKWTIKNIKELVPQVQSYGN